jgi:hypothetical protein
MNRNDFLKVVVVVVGGASLGMSSYVETDADGKVLGDIKNMIEATHVHFWLEYNSEGTRERYRGVIDKYLRTLQMAGRIHDYTVIIDTSNNPSDIIDAGELHGDIYTKLSSISPKYHINFKINPLDISSI